MITGRQPGGVSLYITRDKVWYGRWRKLRVVLDGDEIGNLASGESKLFDVSSGDHELLVQMDWVKSEAVTFTCGEGEEIDARCSSPRFSFSFRDIFSTSIWERASIPFTVTVARRQSLGTDQNDSCGSNA